LDGTGKLTTAQIPSSLVGALQYQGTWNASTNTPTLVSGTGTKGFYYKVSTAGTTTIDTLNQWNVGDMIVYDGTVWDKIDGLSSEVTSVFGRVGAVTATLASSDFVGQGPTNTFLHGNGAGNPSWSAVSLATDVTGTLLAAQAPALTGDVTSTAGSLATTLTTVNANIGTFNTLTVNAKGLVTAASNVAYLTSITSGNVTTALGFTPYNATNPSGYLSSITSGNVTTALGFTPYNATNPSGYLSSITSGSVTTALGFTPYNATNPSGYITSNQTITLSGDVTGSGTTAIAVTLANTTVTTGAYGSATQVPTFVVNNRGQLTSAANVTIPNSLTFTGNVTGSGTVGGSVALTLANVGTAGTYTSVTTDNNGRVISGATTQAWSTITATPTTLAGYGITDGGGGSSIGSTLTLPISATIPASPTLGNVTIFGKTLANRSLIATVDNSGMDAVLQPSMWRQKVSNWNPPGNATTVPGVFGMTAPTSVGTATARTVATTNLFTRQRRLGYVANTTAGSLCGHYIQQAQFTTGDGAGLGGFFYSCRFGVSDTANPVGTRMFVGMSSATNTPTNVEPSTLTNCIGLAQLSTSATQLYIVYGGLLAQTAIALGTNFPPYTGTGATLGVAYDLTLYCPETLNGVVYYRVERIGTTFIAEGTLTPTVVGTQTPASTTLLAHRAWRTNNANTGVVGIDIIGFYTETDY
jgi:hypothetical protein